MDPALKKKNNYLNFFVRLHSFAEGGEPEVQWDFDSVPFWFLPVSLRDVNDVAVSSHGQAWATQ